MALKKSTITPHGFFAADAYHKVSNIRIDNKTRLAFNVDVCKSAEELHTFSVLSFECDYDINGENPLAQAYVYLKTIPEFVGAQDC